MAHRSIRAAASTGLDFNRAIICSRKGARSQPSKAIFNSLATQIGEGVWAAVIRLSIFNSGLRQGDVVRPKGRLSDRRLPGADSRGRLPGPDWPPPAPWRG